MPRADMVPWLLWGDKETVSARSTTGVAYQSSTFQLSKIQYKRPETWTFFLGAHVVTPPPPNLATAVRIDVRFDLMLGVGRSFFSTAYAPPVSDGHFAQLTWVYLAGASSRDRAPKYVTQVRGPILDDTDPDYRETISTFPAESIQVSGEVLLNTFEPNVNVKVELAAFFAPRTHVRPDWYQVDGVPFAGGETGGR